MSRQPAFRALDFERIPLDESLGRARDFHREMNRRRTTRHFSPEPVPRELIEYAIRTAGTAPSGAHLQPWTFVAVSDADLKRRIRLAAEEEERKNYGGRMPEEWLRALAPLQTDWRKEFLETAPALIVVFKQEYGFTAEQQRVTHYYVNESVGIACGFTGSDFSRRYGDAGPAPGEPVCSTRTFCLSCSTASAVGSTSGATSTSTRS